MWLYLLGAGLVGFLVYRFRDVSVPSSITQLSTPDLVGKTVEIPVAAFHPINTVVPVAGVTGNMRVQVLGFSGTVPGELLADVFFFDDAKTQAAYVDKRPPLITSGKPGFGDLQGTFQRSAIIA